MAAKRSLTATELRTFVDTFDVRATAHDLADARVGVEHARTNFELLEALQKKVQTLMDEYRTTLQRTYGEMFTCTNCNDIFPKKTSMTQTSDDDKFTVPLEYVRSQPEERAKIRADAYNRKRSAALLHAQSLAHRHSGPVHHGTVDRRRAHLSDSSAATFEDAKVVTRALAAAENILETTSKAPCFLHCASVSGSGKCTCVAMSDAIDNYIDDIFPSCSETSHRVVHMLHRISQGMYDMGRECDAQAALMCENRLHQQLSDKSGTPNTAEKHD